MIKFIKQNLEKTDLSNLIVMKDLFQLIKEKILKINKEIICKNQQSFYISLVHRKMF